MSTTNSLLVTSAGTVTLSPGATVNVWYTWGANVSSTRWTRLWAGIVSPGDSDNHQSVTITSESSTWDLSQPATTVNTATLVGNGRAPIVARLQVLASQVDTF